MRRRALLLGLGGLALGACGPRHLPPPPSAPPLVTAAELIPADLDVVARLDMTRIKAALGTLTPEALARDVLARGAGANGDEPDELLVASMLSADVVYLGYRPDPSLLPLDRVLALQGRFEPLTRPPSGFAPAIDLGADLRYWDKLPGRPLPRASVARLYAQGDRVRAFVSEAELDAVERALEGLAGPRRLLAPEEGSLSLSARPQRLGRLVSGSLRELLEAAKLLELVIDLESDAAKLKLTLTTAEPAHAEQLASAGKLALSRALGEQAERAELRVDAERVTLSYVASRAELAALLGCLQGGTGSAAQCPW
jgi:hypothetical protein